MFEWLFPNWSNPAAVVALVAARVGVDAALTAAVADAVGRRSLPAVGAATATLLSGVLMVLVLRPGGPGLRASYVELLLQVGLVVVAGYVAYAHRSTARRATVAAAGTGVLALLLVSVPIYGEALVAP